MANPVFGTTTMHVAAWFSVWGEEEAQAFLAEVKTGKSDAEMAAWVRASMKPERLPHEIEAWSRWMEDASPGDKQRHTTFADVIGRLAPERDDIRTTFDRLDLDDYVSFGGKA